MLRTVARTHQNKVSSVTFMPTCLLSACQPEAHQYTVRTVNISSPRPHKHDVICLHLDMSPNRQTELGLSSALCCPDCRTPWREATFVPRTVQIHAALPRPRRNKHFTFQCFCWLSCFLLLISYFYVALNCQQGQIKGFGIELKPPRLCMQVCVCTCVCVCVKSVLV